MDGLTVIAADWPGVAGVRALATGRGGGLSTGPYASLNLGDHVGDEPGRVAANRTRLRTAAGLPGEPLWLRQVHGTAVVSAAPGLHGPEADAAVAGPGVPVVLAILTADCLPVLFTDPGGRYIGAAHAGWRGLSAGVLESTVAALGALGARAEQLQAWLGPAIGPGAYEVGEDVRQAFVVADPGGGAAAFRPSRPGHWFLDLYAAARRRLGRAGVNQVFGGGLCTLTEPARFFSHRRDARAGRQCGRQATLIWRTGGD